MLTSCLSCGRLIQLGSSSRCTDCKPKARRSYEQARARQPHRRNRPYQSREWQQARATAIRNAQSACIECGTSIDLVVHHVTPISEGGSLTDQTNLVVCCRSCHNRIESRDRAKRAR